jgi:hypothetical protein
MSKAELSLVLATLVGLLAAAGAPAQPGLPAAPVPVVPGPPPSGPTLGPPRVLDPAGPVYPGLGPPPPGTVLPPPPPPPPGAPFEDRNGPLLVGDPLLDQPQFGRPGWFAAVDVAVLAPHFNDRLTHTVTLPGGITNTVSLPGADLDWTGSPRLEIGYRMPEGCGEFSLGYRSVVSDARATLFTPDGNVGELKSRLNVNVVDLDYGSPESSLAPNWLMRWKVGVRFAAVYFDSRAAIVLPDPAIPGGGTVMERVSNNFVGAGPHAGLELERHLFGTPLSLYGSLDGAVVVGHISQDFEQVWTFDTTGAQVGGALRDSGTQAVPVLSLQLGVRLAPFGCDGMRLSLGYVFEDWFDVGNLNSSRGYLIDQGIYFRSEFNF